nr:hypothetical protein [Tanacetum cinerariifolium]
MIQPEPEGSTQGYPLVSVEVLRYDKMSKSENMGIELTEMELIMEHNKQGISHEVSGAIFIAIHGHKEEASTAIHGHKEEASSTIKLDDPAKLVSQIQPSFKDLDSLEDDLVIIVDESDKYEPNAKTKDTFVLRSSSPRSSQDQELTNQVLILRSQKHKIELKKSKVEAEAALLNAQPSFPNVEQLNELLLNELLVKSLQTEFSKILSSRDFSSSLPTKLKDLPSKFNELTEGIKGLKTQVHELEIELPKELKEISTKLEDFTKTATSLTSQVTELKTLYDSVEEAHVTGSMVKSSTEKTLKKFDFVTKDGRHIHLSKEQINNQKKLEEEAKAEAAKQEGDVRKAEMVDCFGPEDPLDKLNDLANKKRKHVDDIHDYFKATKMLKSSVDYGDHLPGTVLNEPVLGIKQSPLEKVLLKSAEKYIRFSLKNCVCWKILIDRFQKRLSSWKANSLSIGGRLTLIKVVLGSLGGLQIGSLKAFNLALLQKWRWRLLSSPNNMWVNIIKALHGQEGGLNNQGCSFNDVWSRIIGTSYFLHSKGIIPLNSFCFKVGCSTRVHFWKDFWIGDSPLHTRSDIGTRNMAYLNDLLLEISQIDISVDEDTCTWVLSNDGTFSVKSARRLNDSKLLPSIPTPTVWDKFLLRKVNIILWRLSLDQLPRRLNLSSRGLDIPTISCSSCNGNVESADHVFFKCDLVKEIWCLVRKWCDISIPTFASYDTRNIWFSTWQATKAKSHRLYVIFASLFWWIWRYRNSVTFSLDLIKKCHLFDNIRASSFSWISYRGHVPFNWVKWLKHPLLIAGS